MGILDELNFVAIRCPECRMVSFHPEDVKRGWCGKCHNYTRGRKLTQAETERRKQELDDLHRFVADSRHMIGEAKSHRRRWRRLAAFQFVWSALCASLGINSGIEAFIEWRGTSLFLSLLNGALAVFFWWQWAGTRKDITKTEMYIEKMTTNVDQLDEIAQNESRFWRQPNEQ